MKLYYAQNSRAVRVAWLLEELGLDYEFEKFELGSRGMREPDYLAIHPMGRVPALQDGDVTVFESGAIVQYILALYGHGRLQPKVGTQEYANYLQWLHYCEGMIMPPINSIVVETILLPPERRNEVNVKRATKLLNQMLIAVERHMEGREFLAGEFSGADVMTGHSVIMSGRLGADMDDKPNLQSYADRLMARPALQKAWSL
ncbi:glutathione S-transferase family protein [Primorskyibacter sp. S87]|uniref:glutathione S-transferase family protein n=1 Tax=Primorskyibacter sp. S87 TaxID=3415126 RepID=UPI003C7A1EF6